jgi:hypothetical protein
MLTEEERIRYNRQILAPEIGIGGQERLSHACVLIAGLGGLGSITAKMTGGSLSIQIWAGKFIYIFSTQKISDSA